MLLCPERSVGFGNTSGHFSRILKERNYKIGGVKLEKNDPLGKLIYFSCISICFLKVHYRCISNLNQRYNLLVCAISSKIYTILEFYLTIHDDTHIFAEKLTKKIHCGFFISCCCTRLPSKTAFC